MSENDYIAEYIRDKYPQMLGMDFYVWKLGRQARDAVSAITETLKSIDWSQLKEEENGED